MPKVARSKTILVNNKIVQKGQMMRLCIIIDRRKFKHKCKRDIYCGQRYSLEKIPGIVCPDDDEGDNSAK